MLTDLEEGEYVCVDDYQYQIGKTVTRKALVLRVFHKNPKRIGTRYAGHVAYVKFIDAAGGVGEFNPRSVRRTSALEQLAHALD